MTRSRQVGGSVSCMMSVVCFPVTFANFLFPPPVIILDISSFSGQAWSPGASCLVLPHTGHSVSRTGFSWHGAHNIGQVQPGIVVMDTGRSLTRSHHVTFGVLALTEEETLKDLNLTLIISFNCLGKHINLFIMQGKPQPQFGCWVTRPTSP